MKNLVLMALLLASSIVLHAEDPLRGPWGGEASPARPTRAAAEAQSLGADYSYGLLSFYQNILSKVMVSRCRMLPSCSNYSIDAIHEHGTLLGILMTADRLYHEGSEQHIAPRRLLDGEVRYEDPVEHNDFWWIKDD